MRLWWLSFCVIACAKQPEAPTAADAGAVPPAESRFVRIRELLRLSPEDEGRARTLYPIVAEICASDASQEELVQHAEWVSGGSLGGAAQTAGDVIEHVATACLRDRPEAAFHLLDLAGKRLAHKGRFEVLRARFLATSGRTDEALVAARAARAAGVFHAVSLEANLLADQARAKGPGYAASMLAEAIKAVSIEPDGSWQLVDVMALLSTRAKLLTERSVWEDKAASIATRRLADAVHRRLAVSPFPKQTRALALDAVCFESAAIGDSSHDELAPCTRALSESGNLGAAFLLGAGRDPKAVSLARADAMADMRKRLEKLEKGHVAFVVARGDEVELVAWMHAAAEVVALLDRRAARIIAVDRTSDARASALFDRLFVLADAKPKLTVRLGRDPVAFACLVAAAAKKPGPSPGCADKVSGDATNALAAPFAVAALIGRDLDSEIDDLATAGLPSMLLSLREPKSEHPANAHLTSLSDAWLMSARAVDIAGTIREREKPVAERE
ncbi:MAG: hypothetical protein HY791_14625 [Deltaproteobacteria bacterium]|nr:hypothetical protein [Deltaproteobacteria bacterium]